MSGCFLIQKPKQDKKISPRGKNPMLPFSFFTNTTKTPTFLSSPTSFHQTMASSTLITPTSTPTKLLQPLKPKTTTTTVTLTPTTAPRRRDFLSMTASIVSTTTTCLFLLPMTPALAASDEEYVKETEEVINKVRTTITLERNDPNVAEAVAELRDTSNSWVAKYRREKNLLGRASFRDMYSALNAVSGHYISFGPTAPIPAKRKARILEEVTTAEKALQRGR